MIEWNSFLEQKLKEFKSFLFVVSDEYNLKPS